jgi:ABC-type nitrate/sulfonate/bicarbonate transport system substrate-binding protein
MTTAPVIVSAAQRLKVRLGFQAAFSDAIALAGLRNGYFQADLGSTVALEAIPYTSPAAEETDLAAGRLSAAYLTPVAAIQAWQVSHGAVRIIAGAALAGQDAAVVLAVSTKFLASEPAAVRSLLQGQIQAEDLLATKLTVARPAVQAELTSLGRHFTAPAVSTALATLRFTDNPDAVSIAAQAQGAAASGLIKSVTGLTGIYELTTLDALLRAAGQTPVSG